MSKRQVLWTAIEYLVSIDETELAYELRVVYDSNFREWK